MYYLYNLNAEINLSKIDNLISLATIDTIQQNLVKVLI